jgi:hypothetical protein
MKKLKVLIVAIALFSGTLISTASVDSESSPDFSSEIVKMLEFPPDFKGEIKTSVHFLVNSEGEIVILTVDTKNNKVEEFIKKRMNYKKLKTDLIKGKEYVVPILITLES